MDIGVLDGVSGTDHHTVSEIYSSMAHAGGVVGTFEENQISGLCFCFGDVLAFIPKTVGRGAPDIVAVLVVNPTDVAAAIKASFRGRAAPHIGCAHILLGFLVDGGKFFVSQGFCRNLIVDARCAGAIGATGRQTAVKQVGSATGQSRIPCRGGTS